MLNDTMTEPVWFLSLLSDSNRPPATYKIAALPDELRRQRSSPLAFTLQTELLWSGRS